MWLLAVALAGAADAQVVQLPQRAPKCEPLDPEVFRSFLLDAQNALDRDDTQLELQILDDLHAGIPCLTFAPTARQWADLLVARAIGEFGRDGDWQTPLAAALRIRPTVDRGLGAGHPLASWEPPPADTTSAGPVPEGVALWVDGAPATELPPLAGMHLVQRTEDGAWASILVTDEPIPDAWFAQPVRKPPTFDGWVQIATASGAAALAQQTSWASDYVPEDEWTSSLGGFLVAGLLSYGGVGGHLQLDLPVDANNRLRVVGFQADAVLHGPKMAFGPGVGVAGQTTVITVDGAAEQHDLALLYGDLFLSTRSASGRWDTAWTVGAGPALARVQLRVGRAWISGPIDRRVGLALLIQNGRFKNGEELGLEDRKISAQLVRLSIEFGLGYVPKKRR